MTPFQESTHLALVIIAMIGIALLVRAVFKILRRHKARQRAYLAANKIRERQGIHRKMARSAPAYFHY